MPILDKDYDTSSSVMFADLKWMTFPERGLSQKAVQMYKTCNDIAPDYLKKPFVFTSNIHSKLLRSTLN